MPSTAASAETRTNPVSRERRVPAPTMTLERASDRVLGAASVVMSRRERGRARLAAPAPVHEPPDGEEQAGTHGEEDADPADERRPDRVAGALEREPAVGGGAVYTARGADLGPALRDV